ncbi:MAG TPA: alpha/beta fold hydrolase [Parachlamydiaceae bacterium]|nr:alpha/beta fold hydrolase [Parachlamydiaceae bacterium]
MQRTEERESIVLENEGQKIFGIFHRPCTEGPFPTVLMCHGLAGHKTGKYRVYVNLAERLSKLGIASLRIDFRGSGDSEGSFSEMTLESEVSDAIVALKYLRSRPDVDISRIGLFGRSVGGTVALMAAQRAGPIKTIATWAPLYDGEQWQSQWAMLHAPEVSEADRWEMMKINGQVPGVKFFDQLFAMRMEDHLDDLTHIPMLHIHGDQDMVVTTEHADRYVKARQSVHGKNKFIRLPASDHDFSHTQEQLTALNETSHWFSITL